MASKAALINKIVKKKALIISTLAAIIVLGGCMNTRHVKYPNRPHLQGVTVTYELQSQQTEAMNKAHKEARKYCQARGENATIVNERIVPADLWSATGQELGMAQVRFRCE